MPKMKMVQAKTAIVINVGGEPVEYGQITVIDRRTGEPKTIDNQNNVIKEADNGIPYAFKPLEKVPANHPAVKACPGAFQSVPDDE